MLKKKSLERYMDYLKRRIRTENLSLWQAHQLKLSREVALSYGLNEKQIIKLDNDLKV